MSTVSASATECIFKFIVKHVIWFCVRLLLLTLFDMKQKRATINILPNVAGAPVWLKDSANTFARRQKTQPNRLLG